jgi:putative acetyltransferase
MVNELSVRVMRADEWADTRAVLVNAFDDPEIGALCDLLHSSWSWHDDLAFVAAQAHDGEREQILGAVLFSSAFVDAPDRIVPVLVLSPVGVRRDVQDRGIGSRLITTALEALQSRPEPLVFLEGIPSYYPRFGFRPAAEMGFTAPSVRIPRRAFMAFPLRSYDPSLRGALVYPDAFWRADAVGLRE